MTLARGHFVGGIAKIRDEYQAAWGDVFLPPRALLKVVQIAGVPSAPKALGDSLDKLPSVQRLQVLVDRSLGD